MSLVTSDQDVNECIFKIDQCFQVLSTHHAKIG